MTLSQGQSSDQTNVQRYFDALQYDAPFLLEKLLKEHIVETSVEGALLFTEVKRFCVLVNVDRTRIWEMNSLRIDEVWHQFILFTKEYMDFCNRFFGRYIPHSPSNAPKLEVANPVEEASFESFCIRYEELFGQQLPDLWYDERNVTLHRRIFNDFAGRLSLRDNDGMVDLLASDDEVVLSVNSLARPSLAFITRAGVFYIRELPGELNDEEKVTLVAALVECRILRMKD